MRSLASTGFAWVPRLQRLPRARVDETRFSDEEILTVIRAGEAGMKLPELCDAAGITVDTYYAWKARYGGLTAGQLRDVRLRAQTRRRRLRLLAVAVAVAAAGNGVLMLTRQSNAVAAPLVALAATAAAPAPTTPATPPSATGVTATTGVMGVTATTAVAGAATPKPSPASAAATPVPNPPDPHASLLTGDPNAVSVQVAAVPDLRQAQEALQKLARAGYPAHVTTKVVNGKELYRVRVGPLRSRQLADEIVARLKRDGYSSPWVTH